MNEIRINGGVPLNGNVKVLGARNSALKLVSAALFSNEDVILQNVPRIGALIEDLKIIQSMGAQVDWVSQNGLRINGSSMVTHEVPFDMGMHQKASLLLAGPLVFRFGKASLVKPRNNKDELIPINRYIDTWESLGYKVTQDDNRIYLEGQNFVGSNASFKKSTHTGTENAILSSLFFTGDTYIKNAAEEVEIEDLISFCNQIGASVERIEPRTIKVTGTEVFKGTSFSLQSDKTDVAVYATAAIMTKGNITIDGVNKTHLLSFVNVLHKLGCRYEFYDNQMRVWYTGENFEPISVQTAPAPGLLTEWQPLVTLLATQAHGESIVYETIFTDSLGYIKDLNMMGARITLKRPSEQGFETLIGFDDYDIRVKGEPYSVALVSGPTRLKPSKILISDLISGVAMFIAGLSAEGVSEIQGYNHISRGMDSFIDNLSNLGAQISESQPE